MKNRVSYYTAFIIIICMTAGCIMTKKARQWEPVQPGQRSFVHIVKWHHENLAIISSWYTGSDKNEEKLADNNPNINPKQLVIGDRIFIPSDLLIRRDTIPENFLEQSLQKPEEMKKTEPEPVIEPEKVEKTEPEPIAKPMKTQKTEPKPVTKAPEKKKPATEPEQSPEEEEELNLFGPK